MPRLQGFPDGTPGYSGAILAIATLLR
jgi:hypothetical protein